LAKVARGLTKGQSEYGEGPIRRGVLMRATSRFCVLFALLASPAIAADLPPDAVASTPAFVAMTPRSFWEVRLGASAQDPSGPESGSFNVTGEIVSPKLLTTADPVLSLFIPRAHVGGSVNFNGDTSFAYAGLTWTFDITRNLFVEGSFGGAVHNGEKDVIDPNAHRQSLGCSPLFRESGSVGVRLSANWSVMATVEHLSNAGLCSENRGLTNIGARVGYTF
jgi:hypothetical protein